MYLTPHPKLSDKFLFIFHLGDFYRSYQNILPTSCQDLYNWGYRTTGLYTLDRDGEDGNTVPSDVTCDFTGMDTSKYIVTSHEQWNHMNVMAPEVTGNSAVCSTAFLG